ncbi:MAG: RDD family protein [Pirellulaceae bacterium]|nr:RDD family protein [Pirellulaceae bacterium]
MDKCHPPLDLTVAVTTPENISFEYQLAGPFRRLPAFLLDIAFRSLIVFLMLFLVLFFGIGNFLPGSGTLLAAFSIIGVFLLSWFYGLFFEAWWNGQTPGKRVLGLRVVSSDGRPINAAQATIRNFLRVADFFPYASLQVFGSEQDLYILPTFLVTLVCMLMTRRFQRLGDLAAGTMVVVDERIWYPKKAIMDDPRITSLTEFIPASFRMSPSLAKTIALYVERRASMSPRRRESTAATLAIPLILQFGFLPDTSSDLLLCSIYYREFFLDPKAIDETSTKFLNGSPLVEQIIAPALIGPTAISTSNMEASS